MYKIFVVEDNSEIREELKALLKNNGYETVAPEEFGNIPDMVKNEQPHLILMDINLPGTDGFGICTKIRTFSRVPIIFVTCRDTDMDELMSITIGGDDFVRKPYNTAVLMARIGALLKRTYNGSSSEEVLSHKGVELNVPTSSVSFGENSIDLTKNEIKILYFLFKNKGKIVSREDIIDFLWDSQLFVNDNTLTVNITRIRGKLQDIGVSDFIQTKRRQGYII